MRVRPCIRRGHGLLTFCRESFHPLLKSFRLADLLQHRLMAGAQGGNVVLQKRQFRLIGFVDLIIGGLDLFQFALERIEGAFITLIGKVCLLPLLLQTVNVRLDLSEFICPGFDFVFGRVIRPL